MVWGTHTTPRNGTPTGLSSRNRKKCASSPRKKKSAFPRSSIKPGTRCISRIGVVPVCSTNSIVFLLECCIATSSPNLRLCLFVLLLRMFLVTRTLGPFNLHIPQPTTPYFASFSTQYCKRNRKMNFPSAPDDQISIYHTLSWIGISGSHRAHPLLPVYFVKISWGY
jgi:hypothetical protein